MAQQRPSLVSDALVDVHVALPPSKDRLLAPESRNEAIQPRRAKRDRLVQCSFRLPVSLLDALEEHSQKMDVAVSEIVRMAIAEHMKKLGI
jgi:Ribbon-helix-helix protein, copG family